MSAHSPGLVPRVPAGPTDVAPRRAATPYLRLDVETAIAKFRRLAAALPGTDIHYAVKANPEPALLAALHAAGSKFDVASPAEVDATLSVGASPSDLVHSNPVTRRSDLVLAAAQGVRLFVVDSLEETAKVASAAPGAAVLCRLVTSGEGSDWPLSCKFGCSTDQAVAVLHYASSVGLEAAGVSFHVGSQQRDPGAWAAPIAASARVFELLGATGCRPRLLDLGGGFPANLDADCLAPEIYGRTIEGLLDKHFGTRRPTTMVEPGRSIAAEAGVLSTEVLGVVHRNGARWVFLDVGVFTGLIETIGEAIRYPIETDRDGGPTGPCVIAGPTCDSTDVLYQRTKVDLPLELAEGDVVRLRGTGAYTSCYSSVGFNGFPPLPTHVVR